MERERERLTWKETVGVRAVNVYLRDCREFARNSSERLQLSP